jgi:zinc and cadmium transporter
MLFNSLILFFSAVLGGALAHRFRSMEKFSFDLPLIFAGAYLFGITVVHVIPELFASTSNPVQAGIFVLVGFYMQQLLEYLTSGVEHGHLHKPNDKHKHSSGMAISLLVGLSIHSFLEGSLLGHPTEIASGKTWPLLIGIVLHKTPAAFAMMTVLICQYKKARTPWIYLLIFALASPVGLIFSETVELSGMYSEVLFALVSGSFLHISTTIVFESSPEHKFKISRILISILGALLAILVQVLV